jgi:phage tail protein X
VAEDDRRSFCGNKGCAERPEVVPEDSHLSFNERQPCPVCGSQLRSFTKPVGASLTFGSAHVEAASLVTAHGRVLTPTLEVVLADTATATDEIEVVKEHTEVASTVVATGPTLTPAMLEVLPGLAATHQVLLVWADLDRPGGPGVAAIVSAYGGVLDTVLAESFEDAVLALRPAMSQRFEAPPTIDPLPLDDVDD